MSILAIFLLVIGLLVWLIFHILFVKGYRFHRIDKNPTKHTGA